MLHQSLEVADIFQQHGTLWRKQQAGHLSLGQLKVMSAIERCRSAQLGGHVLRCQSCNHIEISYNSCRNRHCPKCQAIASYRWLEARQVDLLPLDYYHLVFTLPSQVNDLAYQNKSVVYAILFKAVTQTLSLIAANPRHLGAKIGATLVLHTWGSAMTHHPHIHGIVPGGGLSMNHDKWIACKPNFFLSVRVLSRLFRRLFLELLMQAYQEGKLHFFNNLSKIKSEKQFFYWMKPLKKKEWVVYAKKPFAGPKAVLAYLSRYTHRVAIANSRLVKMDKQGITFKYKDYRQKGTQQAQMMTLSADEFIRRFLIHVLPSGFHRIRHIGFLANARRKNNLATIRELLSAEHTTKNTSGEEEKENAGSIELEKQETPLTTFTCKLCGSIMVIIETLERSYKPRAPPACSVH